MAGIANGDDGDLPIWGIGIKLAGESKRAMKAKKTGSAGKAKTKKPKNAVLGLVVERL